MKDVYDFDPKNVEERTVRHFAYSELYDSNNLYERYNILATFFRNITFTFWVVFVIAFCQYILHWLKITLWEIPAPWLQEQSSGILLIFLFAVAVISSRQLFKYSFRRNRHLVIDFYKIISKDGSESKG